MRYKNQKKPYKKKVDTLYQKPYKKSAAELSTALLVCINIGFIAPF
jgi:hypothetical protein|tara:strand:- start:2901 stop:3038 length:138 start_codon:yes stop_codon:yes gene_type:complete